MGDPCEVRQGKSCRTVLGELVAGRGLGRSTEAVAITKALEPMEREAAKERHDEQPKANLGVPDAGNLPPSEKGRTRDKLGAAVGMSVRVGRFQVQNCSIAYPTASLY